jgi:hypothetical protein
MHFADPSHQKTTGNRGKTTRRKSTKTVRGPEGAYIAMMKEELLAMEPWVAFRLYCHCHTYGAAGEILSTHYLVLGSHKSREEADAALTEKLERDARWKSNCPHEYSIKQVVLKHVWKDGEIWTVEVE